MLPTAKIDFIDFLQSEAFFLKTNYITFSNLPIPIDKQNMSEKKIFLSGRWLLNFYRHKFTLKEIKRFRQLNLFVLYHTEIKFNDNVYLICYRFLTHSRIRKQPPKRSILGGCLGEMVVYESIDHIGSQFSIISIR